MISDLVPDDLWIRIAPMLPPLFSGGIGSGVGKTRWVVERTFA